jgi:hypothetical protein
MRTLILSAALSVGALVGLAPAKADANRPGEVPHARYDPGYYGGPSCYYARAYGFGTTSGDSYGLLYYMMPWYASYPAPPVGYYSQPSHAPYRTDGSTTPVPAAGTVRGQVKKVSADEGEFVLGDVYGKDWTFHLALGAREPRNARGSTIADLEVGDHVAVTYERMGNRWVAIAMQYSDRLAGLRIPADTRR